MTLNICLAGATGWAGAALARGITRHAGLSLTAAVSRSCAGRRLGEVLGIEDLATPIFSTVDAALARRCDVFVEYTGAPGAKDHVLAALARGAHVVVGSSGLTDADYGEIDAAAREAGRGVLACGNFSLSAVLLLKCAELASRHLLNWEIIEYASDRKVDVPSGTVREMAARLGARPPRVALTREQMVGEREARGTLVNGIPVHAVRLPGYSLGIDVIFGGAGETLVLRQNAGSGAEPYVAGAIIAITAVTELTGLRRGLDSVLDWSAP